MYLFHFCFLFFANGRDSIRLKNILQYVQEICSWYNDQFLNLMYFLFLALSRADAATVIKINSWDGDTKSQVELTHIATDFDYRYRSNTLMKPVYLEYEDILVDR